jgi:hypothetical protein
MFPLDNNVISINMKGVDSADVVFVKASLNQNDRFPVIIPILLECGKLGVGLLRVVEFSIFQ